MTVLLKKLLVMRITVVANHLIHEAAVRADKQDDFIQMDLFTDYGALEKANTGRWGKEKKERALQEAVLSVKKKIRKYAILEGATGKERNNQIRGHRA